MWNRLGLPIHGMANNRTFLIRRQTNEVIPCHSLSTQMFSVLLLSFFFFLVSGQLEMFFTESTGLAVSVF